MLSGQGKPLWCTQRGGYGGSNPALKFQFVFQLCMHQKYCPNSAPVFMKFKNFVQENVKICTQFTHFASVYWRCPWTQLGDFCPPDALAWLHPFFRQFLIYLLWNPSTVKSWVRLWYNPSQFPSPQGSWLWLPRHTGIMWGNPMLDIARHVICTK